MNKADVVRAVSEKTGIAPGVCEKVIKAFEERAGDALVAKFKGMETDHARVLAGIAGTTGIGAEDCDKVLTALGEVVNTGLSDKLTGFFKRLFSRS